MKLYMVRHGQSQNNLDKKHSGWSHCPLTQSGIEDAKRAGALLEGISFDKVYTSDLPRAISTLQNALPDVPFEPLELLREINVGYLKDRLTSDCVKQFGEEYIATKSRLDFRPYGGEDRALVRARAKEFLDKVAALGAQNVAAFSHAVLILSIAEVIAGDELPFFRLPSNGSVSVFEYTDGGWSLLRWSVTQQL